MEKIKKKELLKIMISNINRRVFIYDNTYYEDFKQIKLDDKYSPYVISSFGRIFNLYYGKSYNYNIKELKTNSNSSNYIKITLHYNNKSYNKWIHRLVAEAFIDNPYDKEEVNHKNGIKTDNYIWNLEWVTHKENVEHAEENNLTYHPKGENNHSKIKEKEVIKISNMILKDYSPKIICKKCKISKQIFQSILHKRKWKHVTKDYDFSNYKYRRK